MLYLYFQESGLPLDVSVKLQINMAMNDVSNMAHVERFSHMFIPMLWFEIAMPGLSQDLQNRFIFYLNILPWIVIICRYGSFVIGIILLTWAIIKASQQLKKNLKRAHNMQQVMSIVSAGQIYASCDAGEIQRILEQDDESEKTEQIFEVRIEDLYF